MSARWYIQRQRSKQLGPFSTEEIVEGLRTLEIPQDSVVNEIGGKQWLPLASVPEFAAVLKGLPPPKDPRAEKAKAAAAASSEAATAPTLAAQSAAAAEVITLPNRRLPPRARQVTTKLPPVRRTNPHVFTFGLPLAVVVLVHTLLQVALHARPSGWLDVLRRFQAVALTREGYLLVVSSILLMGLLRRRTHPKSGTSITFASGVSLVIGIGLFVPWSLLSAARAAAWPMLPPAVRNALVAQQLMLPTLFAMATLALLAMLGERGRVKHLAAVGGVTGLLGVGVGGARRSVAGAGEVYTLPSPARGAPVAVFQSASALESYLLATRRGTAGIDRVMAELSRATVLLPQTKVRWIDDVVLRTYEGILLGREVEVVEGDHRGEHVYVPLVLGENP